MDWVNHMSNLKVAIGDDFLASFAQIPKAKQKKVIEFVAKFRHDPKAFNPITFPLGG